MKSLIPPLFFFFSSPPFFSSFLFLFSPLLSSDQRARLEERLVGLEGHRKAHMDSKAELEQRREKVQATLGSKVEKVNQLKEQHDKNVTQRQEFTRRATDLRDKIKDADSKVRFRCFFLSRSCNEKNQNQIIITIFSCSMLGWIVVTLTGKRSWLMPWRT